MNVRGALKIGLAASAVLVLACALLFMRMLRYGLSAHDEPTAIEASIASRMRRWSVPADLRNMRNPVPLTHEVLAKARAHFADHCASCHGNDGKGQTAIGTHLYPKAPDMSAAKTQALSDGELFSTIENGVRLTGMPGWGDGTAESAYGSWTLVRAALCGNATDGARAQLAVVYCYRLLNHGDQTTCVYRCGCRIGARAGFCATVVALSRSHIKR